MKLIRVTCKDDSDPNFHEKVNNFSKVVYKKAEDALGILGDCIKLYKEISKDEEAIRELREIKGVFPKLNDLYKSFRKSQKLHDELQNY